MHILTSLRIPGLPDRAPVLNFANPFRWNRSSHPLRHARVAALPLVRLLLPLPSHEHVPVGCFLLAHQLVLVALPCLFPPSTLLTPRLRRGRHSLGLLAGDPLLLLVLLVHVSIFVVQVVLVRPLFLHPLVVLRAHELPQPNVHGLRPQHHCCQQSRPAHVARTCVLVLLFSPRQWLAPLLQPALRSMQRQRAAAVAVALPRARHKLNRILSSAQVVHDQLPQRHDGPIRGRRPAQRAVDPDDPLPAACGHRDPVPAARVDHHDRGIIASTVQECHLPHAFCHVTRCLAHGACLHARRVLRAFQQHPHVVQRHRPRHPLPPFTTDSHLPRAGAVRQCAGACRSKRLHGGLHHSVRHPLPACQ